MGDERYNPSEIEKRWRTIWEKERIFQVDLEKAKRPFYNLMMFPYPSGEGLHVGHVCAFSGSDTFGRLKRAQGFDVFEPMGFDSFGIHSENYAIKKGLHPKDLTHQTTSYFREEQLKKLGALFDWDHQVITSDPYYYRWTQWIFIQLFKAGLAVRRESSVGWCPSCKTVLADEQVIAGKCERCSTQVIQKELEQWFFKITNYAERLLKNLDCLPAEALGPKVKVTEEMAKAGIDWSETTKTMQRNWIGRSEGAEIEFPIRPQTTDHRRQQTVDRSQLAVDKIKVFTTRPDTIYGATFMVLAPEHPIVAELLNEKLKIKNEKLEEVKDYVEEAKRKTEIDREKEKTGVFTGLYCINPLTKKEIPIWVADYVLMGYGTGAIMGVPAHDCRDYEFAKKHKLPIVEVISGGDIEKEAYTGEGKLVNSDQFNGLDSLKAIQKISEYIEKNKLGKKTVNYHLRDWLISRQRYWGPPIPMIYCESCASEGKSWFTTDEAKNYQEERKEKILNTKYKIQDTNAMRGWYPVPEEDLPVLLPYLKDYQPKGAGVSPLATLPNFVNVKCPECGKNARRETDVSDTFLDSSWYFLRYPFVGYDDIPFGSERFVDKSTDYRLMTTEKADSLQSTDYSKEKAVDRRRKAVDVAKKWLPVDMYIGGNEHAVLHLLYTRFITAVLQDLGFLNFEEPFKKFRAHGLIIHGGVKMSKSRGNVVNPNDYTQAYGTDTLRMYLLFIGPYDQGGDFSDRAIAGVHRFLKRVYQIAIEISKQESITANNVVAKEINRLVRKVEEDVENLKFNTAVAALMEFANFANKNKSQIDLDSIKKYLIVLSIFAPFTAEELWSRISLASPPRTRRYGADRSATARDEAWSVHQQTWPKVEEEFLQEEVVTIAVQVDGKLRDTIEIKNRSLRALPARQCQSLAGGRPLHGLEELRIKNEAEKLALMSAKVQRHLEAKKIKKTIYVPGKILNIVTEK